MRSPSDPSYTGFSVGHVALYDPKRAEADSTYAVFEVLPIICQEEQSRLFSHRLLERIARLGISPEEYAKVYAIPRAHLLQVAHARNNIFGALRVGEDAPPSERTLAELKDGSPLKEKANSFTNELDKLRFLAAVHEYSGALGGILLELENHISQGQHAHALLAFDDFLVDRELRDGAGITTPAGEEAAIFFARLGGLVGAKNATPTGLGTMLANNSIAAEAMNARNLLRSLYHLDFWSEEERVKLTSS
jgi:hypothetical protein